MLKNKMTIKCKTQTNLNSNNLNKLFLVIINLTKIDVTSIKNYF